MNLALRVAAGAGTCLLALGLGWYVWKHHTAELTVLVEDNSPMERLLVDQQALLTRLAGVKVNIKPFHDSLNPGDAEAVKQQLETSLVVASDRTLAAWKERQWIKAFRVDAKNPGEAWSVPVFAFDVPYLASIDGELDHRTIQSVFTAAKTSEKARFEVVYGSDKPSFLMNILVNADALKIDASQLEATVHWDTDRLLQTLEQWSQALHVQMTAPISCVSDCPVTELLRGNARYAWVDQDAGTAIYQHLNESKHKGWESIQSLQSVRGPVLVNMAAVARPVRAQADDLEKSQAVVKALTSPEFRQAFGPYLVQAPQVDQVSWGAVPNARQEKFQNAVLALLQSFVDGYASPTSTRDSLLKVAL